MQDDAFQSGDTKSAHIPYTVVVAPPPPNLNGIGIAGLRAPWSRDTPAGCQWRTGYVKPVEAMLGAADQAKDSP